jgi:2-dehydropantoate 2-reductase
MACWLGALVARTGARVTLVGSWPAALRRLRSHGIAFESAGLRFDVAVEARAVTDTPTPADVCVLLAKATQTAALAPLAWRHLSAPPLVVSLQNGLGAQALLDAAGAARSATGVAAVGARLVAPAHVHATGTGQVLLGWSGPPVVPPLAAARLENLAEWLRRAGIDARVAPDIETHVWRKLVANCAINGPAALHGVTNGALLEQPELRASFTLAARETRQVARALGVDLAAAPEACAEAVLRATATNRCSMLQDLERGAPTEVEAIYGAVLRLAHAHAVATPTLASLYERLRAAEARQGSDRREQVRA